MAVTKVKSVLAGKYGKALDEAVKKHANDDTTYGVINLPGGITNGIAQLSKCYFKEFGAETTAKRADGSSAKGEYYFRAEGTVDSPSFVETTDGKIPVKGLITSVMVPLCDTKNTAGDITTQEEQLSRVLNIMRQLGGPDFTKGATGGDLEALATSLEQSAPYFRFSTSAGKPSPQYPTPRVFENWHGGMGLENYQPDDIKAFNDQSGGNSTTQTSGSNPQVTQKDEPRQDAIVPVEEMTIEDLMSLASSDADTAQEARQRLVQMAVDAGYEQSYVISEEVGWDDVLNMINNPKQPEEEKQPPKKNETCKYAPPSKKNPGTWLPERECKIKDVDEKNQTVTLTDLTQKGAEYKAVAWDKLV